MTTQTEETVEIPLTRYQQLLDAEEQLQMVVRELRELCDSLEGDKGE